MTETEWLACENPNHALYLLRAVGNRSRRKHRLAAAAGVGPFWVDLSPEQRRAGPAPRRERAGASPAPASRGGRGLREVRAAAVRGGSGAAGTLPWAVARVTHREAATALWTATVLFLPVIDGGPVYTNPPYPEAGAYAERGRPMMAILRCIFG